MDRRLIVLVGLTLAVVSDGFPLALAQSPAPSPSAEPLPPAAALPPPARPAPPTATPEPAPAVPEPAHEQPPAEPPPPASALPMPAVEPAPAPRDPELEKSQGGTKPSAKGAGQDHGPLPPATETPGQVGSGAASEADPFVLPPARLPVGRQAIGLTVDVVGPQFLNLNQMATLKIIVRNTGTVDAMGVVVRDDLPQCLSFLGSQPEAEHGSDSLLFWKLNVVPAGSERTILVRVKPVKAEPFDHAATVTMLAGSKSRTIVREPKLKVEQTATSGKVLKGQQVQFKITITNPGTGPARNVIVQAKLSKGLKHESGEPNDQNLFEQTLDQIEQGQRVVLDALVADTVQAGEQSCEVVAQSTDVTTGVEEARSVASVTVIEPKLKMTISGDDKRFTDTIATYNIELENPGTATAHNVRVLATLPLSGRLVLPAPSGARWDPSSGKLLWTIPQIDPGEKEKVNLTFQVRMGGVGIYQVAAVAKADGGLFGNSTCKTDVHGLADFQFEIAERRRVVDIDDTTAFQIRIKNVGTKEGTRILISAILSKNLEPLETNNGTDDRSQAQWNPDKLTLVFPPIDRLAPNQEVVLGIKVKAKEQGLGTCHVFLLHDELEPNERLEDMAAFKITAPRR